ncbi:MAG TPA: GxxExxY protein [Dongiaceae bacterium]|nr:GxxExxY protein [Dongiaceae bacterium]
MKPNELTREIIGAAIEVHRELGPGKPEGAYETALACELLLRDIPHRKQKPVPVVYKGIKLECGYRIDVLVDNAVVLELKAVEAIAPVHRAQTLTYLRIGGWKVALLLNFNVALLKEGIERFVLGLEEGEPTAAWGRMPQATARPAADPAQEPPCGANTVDPETEPLAREVVSSAIEVHRALGPGLLRSAYEACLCHELHLRGVPFEHGRPLALHYKGALLNESDEVNLLVGGRVVAAPRALPEIKTVHEAQVLSQLRLGGWELGLLIDFNGVLLADGIRRVVYSRRK